MHSLQFICKTSSQFGPIIEATWCPTAQQQCIRKTQNAKEGEKKSILYIYNRMDHGPFSFFAVLLLSVCLSLSLSLFPSFSVAVPPMSVLYFTFLLKYIRKVSDTKTTIFFLMRCARLKEIWQKRHPAKKCITVLMDEIMMAAKCASLARKITVWANACEWVCVWERERQREKKTPEPIDCTQLKAGNIFSDVGGLHTANTSEQQQQLQQRRNRQSRTNERTTPPTTTTKRVRKEEVEEEENEERKQNHSSTSLFARMDVLYILYTRGCLLCTLCVVATFKEYNTWSSILLCQNAHAHRDDYNEEHHSHHQTNQTPFLLQHSAQTHTHTRMHRTHACHANGVNAVCECLNNATNGSWWTGNNNPQQPSHTREPRLLKTSMEIWSTEHQQPESKYYYALSHKHACAHVCT